MNDKEQLETHQEALPEWDGPQVDLLPSPENHPPKNSKPPLRFWLIMLLSGIVIAIIACGFTIFVISQPSNPTPVPAADTNLPLLYPGSTKLTLDDKLTKQLSQSMAGFMSDSKMGFLATDDDYQKVAKYYRQKLSEAGYTTPDLMASISTTQEGIEGVYGTKDNNIVVISIVSTKAWNAPSFNATTDMSSMAKQLKPNQTLIVYITATISSPTGFNMAALASPTPVSATSQAVLGPDNQFYSLNTAGQVMTTPSPKIKATSGEATIQIEWLVSTPSGTRLSVSLTGGKPSSDIAPTGRLTPDATLTDESGKTYSLNSIIGGMPSDSSKEARVYLLQGPALPATVRKLTFLPGEGLPISLAAPLNLTLTTFKESQLPKALALPGVVADLKGIKLRMPYAYFGQDRTVLAINQDTNQLRSLNSGNMVQVLPLNLLQMSGDNNLTIVTDKGQTLEALSTANTDNLAALMGGNNDTILVFKPLPAGTRSLTLKLASQQVSVTQAGFMSEQAAKPETSLTVPIGEAVKSGEIKANSSLDTGIFKIQVVGYKAVLNETDQTAKLTISYSIQTTDKTLDLNKVSLSFTCTKCGAKGSLAMSLPEKLGSTAPATGEYETQITVKYDPTQTELPLQLGILTYTLTGPWQLSIPIAAQP